MDFHNPFLNEYLAVGSEQSKDDLFGGPFGRLQLKYAWALPRREDLEQLIALVTGPFIEIGAGAGYWAWCLRQLGVDVLAFDLEVNPSGKDKRRSKHEVHFTEVLEGTESKVSEYPGCTLFLCYPPSRYPLASNCLRLYSGEYLVYVGPPWQSHEAAGDADFHASLTNQWELVAQIDILNPLQTGDQIFVYRRWPVDKHRKVLHAAQIEESRRMWKMG